jgi:hypothetical protein
MFRETPSGYSTYCSRPANALMSAALPPDRGGLAGC